MSQQPGPRVLFIDDGGVMNDNSVRAVEWQRLVGEFMPAQLGGEPQHWSEANRLTFGPLWEGFLSRLDTFPDHATFQREYDLAWLGGMCEHLGIALPPEARALEIARAASGYITERSRSAYPGVAEAIRALHGAGCELHTASGETSRELHDYLTGMGVRDCFNHLFGPDIVGVMKASPEYYRRAFVRAGVDPKQALVIDDSESACAWAKAAGAPVVHIGTDAANLAAVAARLS